MAAPAIRIRRYRPGDREQLCRLVLELHETLRPLDGDLAPGETIIDTYCEYLLQTQSQTHGAILVAERGTQLVGYVCLFGRLAPEEPDEIDQPHSYIAGLYVHCDFRQQGIGEALLQKAEQHARRLGVRKIELKVLTGNQEAIGFYRHCGYMDRVLVMSKHLHGESHASDD